jgi:HAD superfamily hydrolase (TIGR01509 family)
MAAVLMLDLDNTIADREAAFLTWAESKAKQWAPNQPDAVAFLVEEDANGIRARDEFFALLAERFRLSDPVEALVAEYRRELRAALPPLREDVKERLGAQRAAGWKIALVTNGDAEVQAGKVDQLGLSPFLDACCISGAVGVRKPDPRIFQIAAERCGKALASAWMVGDSEADILGAHRAGISSIWLRRGRIWPRADLRPHHTVTDLADALSILTAAP